MTYHPVRAPEPGVHPFVGWFLTGALVAAISAVLAVVSGSATALYASVGWLACCLAGAALYRYLGQVRSRSVDVRGQVSGETRSALTRAWATFQAAIARSRGPVSRVGHR